MSSEYSNLFSIARKLTLVTGDTISGEEAVRYGWASQVFPEAELEAKVLEQALRVATVSAGILAMHQPTLKEFLKLTAALQERDGKFGDYRSGE